jgi:hypothetical protein
MANGQKRAHAANKVKEDNEARSRCLFTLIKCRLKRAAFLARTVKPAKNEIRDIDKAEEKAKDD